MKKLLVISAILIILISINTGCGTPHTSTTAISTSPVTTSSTTSNGQLIPEPLTDQEKENITQTILTDPEISAIIQNRTYRIETGWIALTGFNPVNQQPEKVVLREDGTIVGNFPTFGLDSTIAIYPSLLIHIGNPEDEQLRVAVNRETIRIVLMDRLVVGDFAPLVESPMLKLEVRTTISGTYDYLNITNLGLVTYLAETGLRFPRPGGEATRTIKTRVLKEDELANLLKLFQDPLINNVTDFRANTEAILTDAQCVISFSYQDVHETIYANDNPLRHDFMSFPDVPYVIKELFIYLYYIANASSGQETNRLIAITAN